MKRKWKIILILSIVLNLATVYVAYKALEYRSYINYFLNKYNEVVKEFSGRDSFEKENQRFVTDTVISNRVVFFGTQVIEKWQLDKYFPSYETINRGITGQKAAGFLLRFRPDVIELKPKAVIIEISSYNFRPQNSIRELEDYIACMAELASFNGIEPILTTLIPPRSDIDKTEFETYMILDSLAEYNDWVKNYCYSMGFSFADLNRLVAGGDGYLTVEYSANIVELNDMGYQRISDENYEYPKKDRLVFESRDDLYIL